MSINLNDINRALRALNDFERTKADIENLGLARVAYELERSQRSITEAMTPITERASQQMITVNNAFSSIAEAAHPLLSQQYFNLPVNSLADASNEIMQGITLLEDLSIFNFVRGLDRFIADCVRAASSVEKVLTAVIEAVPPLVEKPFAPIGFAAFEVWEELSLGRYRAADLFMAHRLRLRPAKSREELYDRRLALWIILRSAMERPFGDVPRWMEIENEEEAAAYLRTAIFNEVRRIRRDREMPERIWWRLDHISDGLSDDEKTERQVPVLVPDLKQLIRGAADDPASIVTRLEGYKLDERVQTLILLYHHGTQQDRDMVTLVFKGYEPVDLAEIYGWSKVQAFQRKAQRWRVIKVGNFI